MGYINTTYLVMIHLEVFFFLYEELKTVLKKYIVLTLAFKIKIVVNQEKCLCFKYKKK